MKKLVIMLGFLLGTLTSAYALSPDEVKGKWESNPIKQEATPDMPMSSVIKLQYNFADDTNVEIKNEVNFTLILGGGNKAEIFMDATAKGHYTVAGDSITVNYIPETVKIKFTEEDIRVSGPDIQPEMEPEVQAEFYKQMSQEVPTIEQGMGQEPDVLNNVLVTGKKMVCNMDDKFVTFKKKK